MKTIFDEETAAGLMARLGRLQPGMQPQWGKMTPWQMLRHCAMSDEMLHGRKPYKRLFIGRLFGGMALRGLMKDESPIKRNQPTHPLMRISGQGDFEAERRRWLELLQAYGRYAAPDLVHPFFGPMTREQVGQYAYKHADHHLRQFGV